MKVKMIGIKYFELNEEEIDILRKARDWAKKQKLSDDLPDDLPDDMQDAIIDIEDAIENFFNYVHWDE